MVHIIAILPAYNEEVSIGSMVLRSKQHVDKVIVVDDGSIDCTVKVAKLAGAEVIEHSENKGKGVALKTGFLAANDTDIIVTMDTDGQHNPDEIPKLVAPIILGKADIVNGSRYLSGTCKNTPAYRRVGQKIIDKFSNLNSRLDMTDTQSGFRAFTANATKVFRFSQSGFGIESEMLVDAALAKLRIIEVEIGVRYDVDCSTEHPISHGVQVLTKVLKDMEFNRPIYYFTVPGIAISGVGIGRGLHFLRDFHLGQNMNVGLISLMVMLAMIGSFMAFTGIILYSISGLIIKNKMNG